MSTTNGYYASPIKTRLSENEPVPQGWHWVDLQEVARLESGHTPSRRNPAYWEGGDVPWLSLKDIRGMTSRYVTDTIDKPTMLGIDNSSARVLPKGTVAFCRTASVGNVAILGRDMATSQDFVDWVCGPNIIPEYLYEAFKASAPTFQNEMQGSTHKTIYMPVVERFKVLLPPVAEQKRIATVLAKADAIRRKRRDVLESFGKIIASAFSHIVGPEADGYDSWETAVLDSLAEFVGGSSLPEGVRFDGQKEGVLLVKVGEMNLPGNEFFVSTAREWRQGYEKKHPFCPSNAIILPKRGGAIGTNKKRLLKRDALIDPNLMGIIPKRDDHVSWIFQWFQRFDLSRLVSGSAIPQLNKRDLAPLVLHVPPPENLELFSRTLEAIRKTRSNAAAAVTESDGLFSSLVNRAFRGEL